MSTPRRHLNKKKRRAEFIHARALAERWGINPSTIWRWVKSGRLSKPRELGPRVRAWPMSVIEAFEEARS